MKRTMALLVLTSINSLAGAQDRPVALNNESVVYQDAAVRVVRMTVALPPHQTTPLGDHLHAVMIPLDDPFDPFRSFRGSRRQRERSRTVKTTRKTFCWSS
jgi:hypothetical protein